MSCIAGWSGEATLPTADGDHGDVGGGQVGDRQELVDLVRADVDEDPAGGVGVPEPVGPPLGPHRVRAGTDHVHDPPDRAGAGEANGLGDRAVLVALGEQHGPRPAGLVGDRRADGVELVDRGEARLVGDHVLAGGDRGEGDLRPPVRDRRGDDQVDRVVGEHLVVGDRLRLGLPAFVVLEESALGHVTRSDRAGLHQPVDDLEHMIVIESVHPQPHTHPTIAFTRAPGSWCRSRTTRWRHRRSGCTGARGVRCRPTAIRGGGRGRAVALRPRQERAGAGEVDDAGRR